MKKELKTVVTDGNGFAIDFKIESYEWNPPKLIHAGVSKSTQAIRGLKIGETKRIMHGDLMCKMKFYNTKGKVVHSRACSLQTEITKMRKQGFELEHYHEADHILVIRRIK